MRANAGTLLLLGAALTGCATGCAPTPAVRAAEQGRFDGLRAALAAGVAQGTLHDGEAADVARALTKGDLQRARGEQDLWLVNELRRCAPEAADGLRSRASNKDSVGAAIALMLVEEDVSSAWRYGRLASAPADDPEGPLRPLGARTLTSRREGELRRKLILDPYEEVRRGAIHAAASAGDEDDREALLEAARVDPYPAARREAILAAGTLGGDRVVNALQDLWPRAADEERAAIVRAWASDRSYSFESGGRARLVWVIETQRGRPVLLAAQKLIEARDDAAGEATAAVERAITGGTTRSRVDAIAEAPLHVESLRAAIEAAEGDSDEAVAAAAMKRHLVDGAASLDAGTRVALVTKLLAIASGNGMGVQIAREALALAHVADVIPLLEHDGTSDDAATRTRAGATLAMYGDLPRAAVVAADAEPHVRATVACEILRVKGRGPSSTLRAD